MNEEKTCIILHSYHHMNTKKVANAMAEVLNADVKMTSEVDLNMLSEYDVIGFGSGIDSAKHYEPLLALAKKLLPVEQKRAFIFSTSALLGDDKVYKDHTTLRDILIQKGYIVIGEFACKGFNTNSFLKLIGGMNKNRPNKEDMKNAKTFAKDLFKNVE